MNLEIQPCKKQFISYENQLLKVLEEYTEVGKAEFEYLENANVSNLREWRRLREHLAEEIIDLITAAVTLGTMQGLNLQDACKRVAKKNLLRGYY